MKEKLQKLSIPEAVRNEVLDGKKTGSTMLEGLVDSVDRVSFDTKLELLLSKWKKHDKLLSGHGTAVSEFCDWFMKNKVEDIQHTMLHPIREEAGLGSPPEAFYTNASESMNNVIKVKVDYKRSELPHFIDKLCALCEEQEREVESLHSHGPAT